MRVRRYLHNITAGGHRQWWKVLLIVVAGGIISHYRNGTIITIHSSIPLPPWKLDASTYHGNTESWLNATRYGNVDHGPYILTDEILEGLLLFRPVPAPSRPMPGGGGGVDGGGGAFVVPLSRSVAMRNSNFLTWGEIPHDEARTALIDSHRLLYLAIHEHQHRHARAEAVRRLNMYGDPGGYAKSMSRLATSGVGRFDYECRDAKFLVGTMDGHAGIGYVIRKQSAPVLLAGLNTGRVVTYVNNINDIPPWGLASCDRHDHQCFFMPMTPCVLTAADLMNGTIIGGDVLGRMLITGRVDDDRYNDARVLIVNPSPHMDLSRARHRQTVHELVRATYDNYTDLFSSVISPSRFEKAEAIIRDPNELWLLEGAAVSYILRPNLVYNAKLKDRMGELFPHDFDAGKALGIPIRSTDKCVRESECLSFAEYVDLSVEFSRKKAEKNKTSMDPISRAHGTIVVTTESRAILDLAIAAKNYTGFPFKVIANDQDVAQDTGNVETIKNNNAGDDVMYSTFTSIQMQLMTGDTIGNCCSNFHKLISIFLGNGYSAGSVNNFECLQENENPAYRVCCQWTNTQFCKNKRSGSI